MLVSSLNSIQLMEGLEFKRTNYSQQMIISRARKIPLGQNCITKPSNIYIQWVGAEHPPQIDLDLFNIIWENKQQNKKNKLSIKKWNNNWPLDG
jgi:hypothetical protein